MFASEFDKIRIIENPNEAESFGREPLLQYDYFLTQTLSDAQKGMKKKGDTVTVYKVTEVRKNGNIVYMPVYIVLEG